MAGSMSSRRGALSAMATPRCAAIHAGVRVAPLDRKGLERLCRYLARPPLGRERLEERPDGSILLRLKTAWSDGTAALQLSQSELLQRILALIPPPRKNENLFHGVFASRHAWRSEIVPDPPADSTPEHLRIRLTKEPALGPQPAWLAWAALMWRIFQEDRVSCPRCGKPMKVRTVVMPPASGARLGPLGRPLLPQAASPANSPLDCWPMRVVKGLERAAARAPPDQVGENARDPLAVVA